jgi:hypothetical protein
MTRALRAFAALAFACAAAPSAAADLQTRKEAPPAPAPANPFLDAAFGFKLMSDYIARGVTQSNHRPAVTAYGEARLNPSEALQLYAGAQLWSVKLPTNPALEVDLYAGLRPTFGPLAFDLGAIWYAYPDNARRYWIDAAGVTALTPVPGALPTTPKNPGWGEVYAKATWTLNDTVALGANLYHSPNWTNTGARATYASATVKANLPKDFYVSGEFGRQWLGTSRAALGPTKYKSYNAWNVGAGYVYKVATLDLRYSGTDLKKSSCWLNTSDPAGNPVGVIANGRSGWCGHRVAATLSVDISGKDLK